MGSSLVGVMGSSSGVVWRRNPGLVWRRGLILVLRSFLTDNAISGYEKVVVSSDHFQESKVSILRFHLRWMHGIFDDQVPQSC